MKFLKENLEKAGCLIGDRFIKAVECDKKISGGYVRGEGVCIISKTSMFILPFSLLCFSLEETKYNFLI